MKKKATPETPGHSNAQIMLGQHSEDYSTGSGGISMVLSVLCLCHLARSFWSILLCGPPKLGIRD